MIPSEQCYQLIEHYESCQLKAKPDPKTGGAPWTVGWGATGFGIIEGTVWTQEKADGRLMVDVARFAGLANNALTVPMLQGQFDAFVSALFNIGPGVAGVKDGLLRLKSGVPSTFLLKLTQKDYTGAKFQLGRWYSPGTIVAHGLRRRRAAEQALWDGKTAAEAIEIGDAL